MKYSPFVIYYKLVIKGTQVKCKNFLVYWKKKYLDWVD